MFPVSERSRRRLRASLGWILILSTVALGSPELLETGNAPRYSQLRLPAILYLNPFFEERINRVLAEPGTHHLMQVPLELPGSWKANEQIFWDAHLFENRLNNASRLGEWFLNLNRPVYQRALRKNDPAILQALQPLTDIPARLQAATRALQENEAVLRLRELPLAEQTWRRTGDYEARMAAAFAMEMAAAFAMEMAADHLDAFFADAENGSLTHPELLQPGIRQTIIDLLSSGRGHGAETANQAMLLRIGACWWLRGHYGMSTEAFGLLKPPVAMQNQQAMFGLYMPVSRPGPVD